MSVTYFCLVLFNSTYHVNCLYHAVLTVCGKAFVMVLLLFLSFIIISMKSSNYFAIVFFYLVIIF